MEKEVFFFKNKIKGHRYLIHFKSDHGFESDGWAVTELWFQNTKLAREYVTQYMPDWKLLRRIPETCISNTKQLTDLWNKGKLLTTEFVNGKLMGFN